MTPCARCGPTARLEIHTSNLALSRACSVHLLSGAARALCCCARGAPLISTAPALQSQRLMRGKLITCAVVHQVSTQRSVTGGIPDVSIQMSDPGSNPDPLKMVSPHAPAVLLLSTARAQKSRPTCYPKSTLCSLLLSRLSPALSCAHSREQALLPVVSHVSMSLWSALCRKNLDPSICLQVPFMVGDFVTYAGVTTGAGFFAAYEIVSNVAVYTKVSRRRPTLQRNVTVSPLPRQPHPQRSPATLLACGSCPAWSRWALAQGREAQTKPQRQMRLIRMIRATAARR
jgi:hypothetical protein